MSLKYDFPVFSTSGNFIVEVIGDGTSTILTFVLADPPFNLDLKGNLPIDVSQTNGAVTISLSSDHKKVTITFGTAPANGAIVQLQILLIFAGA